MKFSYINKINFKKLRTYKGKSMYLIIPIIFLMALGIVVSSQSANIQKASQDVIFGTAKEASRLIELTSDQSTGASQDFRRQMMMGGDSDYKDSDLEVISAMENVETASLTPSVPIDQIITDDLFDDLTLHLNNIVSLEENVAGLYTDQNFTYIEGQPIPIILNANGLINEYEDWNGQDEITLDIGNSIRGGVPATDPGADREVMENNAPFKFEAIAYDKDELIGQEFTLSFGGLDAIETYETEFTSTGLLYRKLSEESVQEKIDQRKNNISQYWDYEVLSSPQTYTFKVVGVLETEGKSNTYIPSSFANVLINEYIQNEIDARNDTEIPTDDLNNIWNGMTYDGLELTSSDFGGVGSFRPGSMIRDALGNTSEDTEAEEQVSYTIPGLVIETEREEGSSDAFQKRIFGSSATVVGVYTESNVYDEAVKNSDTILIKLSDSSVRSSVVQQLNDAGYAYQNLNDLEVFSELQDTLNNVSTVVTISFIILTAIIIVLTMGKFVSESKKEIGVFRAIGATKADIKKLFMSQAIMYTLIAYIIGVIIGIGLVVIIAKPVQLWFDNFIEKTLDETFSVVQQTSATVYLQIDWQMLGIYTALLFLIAVIVSFIPATRASRVSPVQAIRNE